MEGFIFIFGFLAFLGFLAFFGYAVNRKQQKTKHLKEQYDFALLGTDKRAALLAGRAYYRLLRGGTLSIYDEQAITNDISTMMEK